MEKTVAIIAGVAILISAAFFWHKSEIKVALAKQEAAMIIDHKKQTDKLKDEKRESEDELKATLAANQKEKKDEIKRISSKYESIISELRNRQPRPDSGTSVPNPPGATEGQQFATGKELYREDAEFLVGEARDADIIRTELKVCYKDYDDVRQKLIEFSTVGK